MGPEEEEWLIGFMLLRLLEIRTNVVSDSYVSTWMREEFLAIHLFQKQIFSIDGNMKYLVAQWLRVHRRECCAANSKLMFKSSANQWSKDWNARMKYLCVSVTEHQKTGFSNLSMIVVNKNSEKENRVYAILWNKFNEFR